MVNHKNPFESENYEGENYPNLPNDLYNFAIDSNQNSPPIIFYPNLGDNIGDFASLGFVPFWEFGDYNFNPNIPYTVLTTHNNLSFVTIKGFKIPCITYVKDKNPFKAVQLTFNGTRPLLPFYHNLRSDKNLDYPSYPYLIYPEHMGVYFHREERLPYDFNIYRLPQNFLWLANSPSSNQEGPFFIVNPRFDAVMEYGFQF